MALVTVLATLIIVTAIAMSLVGLLHTDITHASIQHAVASSFAVAQAGLAEAQAAVFAASDPFTYTNPSGTAGEQRPYGQNGQFIYWVDTGPAAGSPCGPGLKTLEALGEVTYLRRQIPARVRACGLPGTPYLAALFGVSIVEAQGATSRTYIVPFQASTPGSPRGGALGSFTEINFGDAGVHLNAVSETGVETLALRDGVFPDYALFGFSSRPAYEANPAVEPVPWITAVFGDIIKAQPTTGPLANRCGTAFACVTAQNSSTDVPSIQALRAAEHMRHAYMNGMVQQVLPPLVFDPDSMRSMAAANGANQTLNQDAGLGGKTDSVYAPAEFTLLVAHLASHCPPRCLRGTVYVDGTYRFMQTVTLGGESGDVTLAVRGDLIIDGNISVTNRHDLSTVAGRRLPGVMVFGLATPTPGSTNACGGNQVNGSGRFILCGGSSQRLTVDGLLYSVDGMVIGPQAMVDQIGAMHHSNRGTANRSFTNQNGTLVIRFDPMALSAVGRGLTVVSWQQLR